MIFDSHCHLLLIEEQGKDLSSVIANSIKNGVSYLLDVSVGLSDFFKRLSRIKEIKEKNKISINISAGIPPYFADKREKNDLDFLYNQANSDELVVAIGEIGLDYHYNYGTPKLQKELLVQQIDIANELNFPIIIHTRDADKDLIEILRSHNPKMGGVIHCFSSNYTTAKTLMDLGFYISFSGNLTYKKSFDIQEAALKSPIDKIFIETDAPYLAPQKYRGNVNEPGFIVETTLFLANLKNMDFEDICTKTMGNTKNLFDIT